MTRAILFALIFWLALAAGLKAFADTYGPYPEQNYTTCGNPADKVAAIEVHGGWDSAGDMLKPNIMKLCTFLGNRGVYVININYRLDGDPHQAAPAQWQDVQTAIAFAHSKGFKRVTAIGYSAGAYNVAGVALQAGTIVYRNTDPLNEAALYPGVSRAADAYVLVSPFSDLTDTALNQDAVAALTANYTQIGLMPQPSASAKASPITYINSIAAPILLFHGDADTVVPIAQSDRFVAQLNAAGVNVNYQVFHGGHVFAGVKQDVLVTMYQQIVALAKDK